MRDDFMTVDDLIQELRDDPVFADAVYKSEKKSRNMSPRRMKKLVEAYCIDVTVLRPDTPPSTDCTPPKTP